MDISIIIAASRNSVNECIKSIEKQNFDLKKCEIIVVSTKKFKLNSNIKFIRVKNNNPAYLRNVGAKIAKGKILAFIDDDAIAEVNWLKKGLKNISSDISGVGGANLLPKKHTYLQEISDILITSKLSRGIPSFSKNGRKKMAIPGDIPACNLFIKKSVFLKIGGFNEAVGYGGEDTELIYIAMKKGFKFIFDPNLIVYHQRREFGWNYLKQKFIFRVNTGLLFITYPDIYIQNKLFLLFLISLVIIPTLIIKSLGVYLIASYFFLIISYSINKVGLKKQLIILPLAFFSHHFIYYVGTTVGILMALIMQKNVQKIREYRKLSLF